MAGPLPDDSSLLASLGIGSPGTPPLPSGPVQSGSAVMAPSSGSGGGIPSGTGSVGTLVAQQQRNLANGQAQMASDFAQIQKQADVITAATQASGQDEVTIATQKAQGLLSAQDQARQVAASYGGNPDDVSFIMNRLGAEWEQAESDRQQALNVVQKKQSVSFLDDPLTWLSNKFTINRDIDMYNDDEERSNTLYQQLTRINALNTSTADSFRAIAKTQTAATVAATADQASQNAAIASAKAQIQGLTYNAQGINDVTKLGQDQVSNAVQNAQVAIAAGHLAVAQQQVKIMENEYNQKAQLYAQEVHDKQQADAQDAQMLKYMNMGRATLGLPALDGVKAWSMLKAGGTAGDVAKQAISIGMSTDALGKPVIASTSGTAARILAETNSPLHSVNAAVKPVTDLLANAYNQARNPLQAGALGVNPKDVSTLDNATSGIVKQQVSLMASSIKPGDQSNIFQAPPLTSLATLPSVQQNTLYQKVLAPQVKAGMSESDPNKVIGLTIDAVKNGTISLPDAAAGVANLYSSAAALNTQTKDYTRFGIAPQATYLTDLDFTGTFGGTAKIDLTNKAQVTTALTKLMSSIYEQQRIEGYKQGLPTNASIFDRMMGGQ